MPTACIQQPDCSVHLVSQRLEVRRRNQETAGTEVVREIPLRDLDRVILMEGVQVSSHALTALLRQEIPVTLLGWTGQFLGGFTPATAAHGLARLNQYRQTSDPAFALQMAGRIVTAKLYNQRRVLQRLSLSRSKVAGEGAAEAVRTANAALTWLDQLFASISQSKAIDELRGYEGASTARYFQAWSGFLPPEFPFERRSTRPPLNPVNACISFGATLLYSETAAFIQSHGLDPALGLLHRTENGRWSLALDLLEPFRPVLVEALALDLFSHEMLKANCFEARDGGVYLNENGRHQFILQYERRMERQFMSECAGHRTTLRQQLEQQAVMYKAALENPGAFEPFLMN